MPGYADVESLCMKVISSVSAVASMSAVAMYLRFPHLRKKSYFTLQFYVAVSNVLTSIGSAIGVVQTGTVACWSQGLLTNIFTLSSIQWTTVMAFSLFSIVHYEKQIDVTPLVHAYCWLPPILASVLPLINSTYGNVGNWCWVVSTSHTPPWGETFWFWFSFYGWVWLDLFLMGAILGEINYSISQKKATTTVKSLQKIISTLNLFPLIILIAWGPACASDSIWEMFNLYSASFGALTSVLACSQGLFTALLFWLRNPEVRRLVPIFFKLDAPVKPERGARRREEGALRANSSQDSSVSSSSSPHTSLSEHISLQFTSLRGKLRPETAGGGGSRGEGAIRAESFLNFPSHSSVSSTTTNTNTALKVELSRTISAPRSLPPTSDVDPSTAPSPALVMVPATIEESVSPLRMLEGDPDGVQEIELPFSHLPLRQVSLDIV
jgi:hypothetical protein